MKPSPVFAALAGLAVATWHAPTPQASAPRPTPGSVAYTPANFTLPKGSDCKAAIARYRAIQDNDLSMGHVAQSVYHQIKREIDAAETRLRRRPRRSGEGDDRRLPTASRLPDPM